MNTPVKYLAAVIASVLSSAGTAAQIEAEETISVVGQQSHYKVDQAHGAMRADISLLDTPQSVVIIPLEVMEDQLIVTLGDALRNDASVSIGRVTTDRERFSLRGFSLQESTNILKNGHQHFSKYRLPMALIDNVEILKGPSGLLYGQSTPGGLVNLITKKPSYQPLLNLSFKGDQYGSVRGMVDAGGSLTADQSVRYRAIIEKEQNKSWRRYQNGERQQSDFLVGSLMLDFDLSDQLTLSVHYDHSDEVAGQDSAGLIDDKGQVVGSRDVIWDMPWTKIDAQSQNYGVELVYQINDYWQLSTGFNQQDNDRERWESKPQTDDYDSETTSYGQKPYNKLETWDQAASYFDLTGTFTLANIEHNILVGGNYLDHKYQAQKVKGKINDGNLMAALIVPQPVLSYQDAKSKGQSYDYYGIYAQDLMTINEQWQMLVGIRYDKQHKEASNNSSVLPRFGVIYHPIDNASLYVNYSKSFEPQGMVDNDEDVNFGMDLKPIDGEMFELGGKLELMAGDLRVNGAIFDITRSNILVNQGTKDLPQTVQGGEQRHRGIELGGIGQLTEQLSLITSVMYLDAAYTAHDKYQGNRPADVPEWTGSIWAKYALNDRTALNLGAFYEGSRLGDDKNEFTKPGYTRVDAGISYLLPVAGNDVNLRLKVENLFDKDYLAGGENGEVNIGKPRTIKFAISYNF
ncbi:MAG: TonB-dependent siderophore receptor [Gammaproteobacteria bacterium]|nr:TonB-dependent siderophore receptor [Gammaproteobacteria bacterium]